MNGERYPPSLGGGLIEPDTPAPPVPAEVIAAAEAQDRKRIQQAVAVLLKGGKLPERWEDERRIANAARAIIQQETGGKKWTPKSKQHQKKRPRN